MRNRKQNLSDHIDYPNPFLHFVAPPLPMLFLQTSGLNLTFWPWLTKQTIRPVKQALSSHLQERFHRLNSTDLSIVIFIPTFLALSTNALGYRPFDHLPADHRRQGSYEFIFIIRNRQKALVEHLFPTRPHTQSSDETIQFDGWILLKVLMNSCHFWGRQRFCNFF